MTRAIDGRAHAAILSRRGLLGGMCCAFAGALCATHGEAIAATGSQSFNLGAMKVTIVSDGSFTLPLSFVLPSMARDQVHSLLSGRSSLADTIEMPANVVAVERGADVILIDAGGGTQFMPTLGKLPERLEEAGIARDKITKVVFTHAHADHLWGVIDDFDEANHFPNATYVIGLAEWDFWIAQETAERMPEALKGMAAGSRRRLKIIESRIDRRKAGDQLAPGVTYVDTAGHTPGHMSVLLDGGGDARLLVGGDALNHSIISIERPAWRWGSDQDPDKAAATRRRLLDMLATDRIGLLGYHIPFPGKGRIERSGDGYRFIAG